MRRSISTVRRCLIGLGLALAAATSHADEPLKIAFVFLGPIGDGGWTYQTNQGRLALEKAMGSKIKTTYVENVPESADAERVLRQLAMDGNQLIFACSFGYGESVLKVAKMFPKVHFEHVNGFKTAPNVVDYQPRFEEGFYLLGVVAGRMTKSNTLGFIGSFPIPDVVRDVDAYTLGAQSVNPKVKTKVIWVNTWYDPGKERQAAEALIALGADVLSENTDSPAPIQAAEAKGVYAFALDSDMSKYGPKAHLTASTEDWGGYFIQEANKQLDGSWTGNRQTRWGLKEGMVVLAPFNAAVPPAVVKEVEAKKKEFVDGTFDPFKGPVKDNTGAVRVAAGAKMSTPDYMSINWYVDGIDGTLPK